MTPKLIYTGPSPDGIHADESAALCLRRRGFERELGPVDVDARARGTLVHIGLAHHYQRLQEVQEKRDPGAYLSPDDAVCRVAETEGKVYIEQLPLVRSFLAEYGKLAKTRDYGLRVLGVEMQVQIRLPGWDALGLPPKTARLDLLALQDGGLKVIDHKSAGYAAAGSEHAWIYARTMQFLLLTWLAAQFPTIVPGSPMGKVVLNLCQVNEKGHKVLRPTLDPVHGRLASLPMALAWTRILRKFWEESGLPAREWPATYSEQTCRGRYSRCDYAAACDAARPDVIEGGEGVLALLNHLRHFVG